MIIQLTVDNIVYLKIVFYGILAARVGRASFKRHIRLYVLKQEFGSTKSQPQTNIEVCTPQTFIVEEVLVY